MTYDWVSALVLTALLFGMTVVGRFLAFKVPALARMRELLPQTYLQEMPAGSVPGISEPTNVNVFDYTFFAGKDVSEETVYKAVKALWAKESDLLAGGPFWNGFTKEGMGKQVGLTYHPGAVKFYKEMGVWPK